MRPTFSRLAGLMAAVAALAAGPRVLAAQKALVYCPAADTRGCDAIVAALGPGFPGGVDRASDAGLGVDLRTADLFTYAAFVVPSLADNATSQPYAFLRDAAVAHKLRDALMGRRVFWSGTPDQGSTNRTLKDALLANLARFAASNNAAARGPGLVVLQDVSDDASARYGWLRGILGVNLTADAALTSYGSVRGMTATATEILTSGGTLIAYSNMAMQGFQLPTGAAGVTLDAVGQTGTSTGGQVVLATMAGVSATSAVVSTDADDYAPGTTVVMTGAGFQAGETVSLVLHEDPEVHTARSFTTTVDGQGRFTFTGFAPEHHDIGVRFILTATGQTSGYRAQTTFTDAPKVGSVSSAPTSRSVAQGQTATYTLTIERGAGNGSTGAVAGPITVVSGLPAGASASSAQFSLTSQQSSGTADLSIGTIASTPTGTYTLTVRAATGAQDYAETTVTLQVTAGCTVPAVTAQPGAVSISYGAGASFTATASGSPTVQWESSSNGTTWTPIGGETSGTLTLTAPTVAQSGTQYRAVFTNGCGTATSSPATLSVTAKALTITGVTASNKVYDGNAVATVSTASATLGGKVGSDDVTLSGTAVGAFQSATVGTAKPVSITGLTLTGTAAGNYSLAQPTGVTADITPATASVVFGASSYACTYGTPCTAPMATANGLASPAVSPTGTVAITYSGTANDGSSASGTTLPTKAGTYTATATYTPGASDNYKAPSTAPTATLTIGRGSVGLSATGTTFAYSGNPTGPTFAGDVAQVEIKYSGVSPTTYGPDATQPTNVGSYAFAATLKDANNYAFDAGATTSGSFVVTRAAATVAFSGAPYNCTYDPAATCAASAAATGLASPALAPTGLVAVTYSGTANDGTTLTNATAAPVKAGTYTATATYTPGSGDNYEAPATAPTATVTISRASVTVTFPANTPVDYNGSPRSVSAASVSPSGFSGFTVKYDAATQAPSNVGAYTVSAALTDPHNYALSGASTTGQLVIAPVDATVAFSQPSYTCTFGAACTAPSATASGLGSPASSPVGAVAITYSGTANDGTTLSNSATAPAKAGSYTATAIYTPGTGDNYKAPTTAPTASFMIGRATPLVVVTQPDAIVYGTANATISGTAKTAGGLAASGSIDVAVNGGAAVTVAIDQTTGAFSATVPTGALNANLAGYGVSASYVQTANFAAATDVSKNLVVNKAPATGLFSLATLPTKTYGDAAFSVAGAAYAQPGTSTVAQTFALGADSEGCTITTDGMVTITGATGVGKACVIRASQLEGTNHLAGSVESGFSIAKATPIVTAVVTGSPFTYDAQPHAATATVTGVNATTLTVPTAQLSFAYTPSGSNASANTPVNAGTYAVVATFAGDANYNGVSSTNAVNLVINRATPVVSVTQPVAIMYGTANATISGTAKTSGGLAASGTIAVAVNSGTAVTASIDQTTGAFAATVPTAALNADATGYEISASYAQTTNFANANDASKKLVVTRAPATIAFSQATYSCIYAPAATCAASATKNGLGSGFSAPTGNVTITYTGSANDGTSLTNAPTAPTKAGTYTATATYVPGASDNYMAPVIAPTASVTITKAEASILRFDDLTKQYTGGVLKPLAVTNPAGVQVALSFSQDGMSKGSPSGVAPVGVYKVVGAIDDPNYAGPSAEAFFVIYDPSGGFVTGGGWINSPANACLLATVCLDASGNSLGITGKANFGFVSKYQTGANRTIALTGNTEFQFKAGNINFKSTSYEWLTVAGARAQYKGRGTINGAGDYGFMLTAIDGDVNGGRDLDRFRIKIWLGSDDTKVVYDNQLGAADDAGLNDATVLGGGSIQIKK